MNGGGNWESWCSMSNTTHQQYFTFHAPSFTITDYNDINWPKNVVIPCKINGVDVKYIGANAFMNKGLTSVIMWTNIIDLWNYAFAENQLTSITIPNNIRSIGLGAFQWNQLNSINFSSKMTARETWEYNNDSLHIWEYAFEGNQLTSVSLPTHLAGISAHAFQNNQINSLVISNGGWHGSPIHEWAFAMNQITTLSIPDNFTFIWEYAFYENQINTITLHEGITYIGGNAFTYQSTAGGTIYGPASGYVKDTYTDNINNEFDKGVYSAYIDL